MESRRYELNFVTNREVFEFESIGPKGIIKKRIQFELVDAGRAIYNLAFGDIDAETDELDDTVVSNNGDTYMVLSTVVAATEIFFESHPNVVLYAIGSTAARTRLYQIGINKFLSIGQQKFQILGEKANSWEVFQSGTVYDSFLVRKNE